MCKKCSSTSCTCVPKKGERGLQGLPGPQGPQGAPGFPNQIVVVGANDIVVNENTVGAITTYTVGRPKEFFYNEVVSTINVDDATWLYHFPVGYAGLVYTNATLVPKTYLVQGSYDAAAPMGSNAAGHENWVEGAIIKTVLAVDSVQWESDGHMLLSANLYNGPGAGDVVNSVTTNFVVDNLGNHVEVRLTTALIPSNTSFFKYLTLAPGESVSLQFRAKGGSTGILKKAQLVVQEI